MDIASTLVLAATGILAVGTAVLGLRYLIGERRSRRRIARRLAAIGKSPSIVDKRLDRIVLGDVPHGPIGRVATTPHPLDGPQLIG